MTNRISPMSDDEFSDFIERQTPKNINIVKYLITTRNKLKEFNKIAVSYSGGSDSDIVLDLIELVKPPEGGEIQYVFFDTGLEWDATLRHVRATSDKYGVDIEIRKPKKPIPVAVKEYGVPFLTKDVSNKIYRAQYHNFDWTLSKEEVAGWSPDEAKGQVNVQGWWSGTYGRSFSIDRHYLLRDFLQSYPPEMKISDKCCDYAKKNVAKDFNKEYNPDLRIDGQRQCESGRRSAIHSSCFEPATIYGAAHYMPLFFWSNEDKAEYKQWRSIKYSDCYEIWGLERTGCLGCPLANDAEKELNIALPFEPIKVKAAYSVFGNSYEYRKKYAAYKEARKNEFGTEKEYERTQ